LKKVLKYAIILYILARHLQIDADPDPAYKFWCGSEFLFDADTDPDGKLPKWCGSGSATLVTGQLERRVPELRHEEADRLGEEALHELIRHALQVPEPGGQKVQQLKRHVKENEDWNKEVPCRFSDFCIWKRKNPYLGSKSNLK
jgi:hypothetical protein